MKFNDTLTEIIRLGLETNQVPALMGEPGIGKSSFVHELAASMGTKSFTLSCNQLADKADLTGARLVPTQDGTSYTQMFYPHFVVQEAINYAQENPREWPILFFDEINRTTPDVTSAALTMITERRLGYINFPDNLRIMIAGNDKGNVTALDDASISRFVVYNVEPDATTLIQLLGDQVNPHIKSVLTKHPNLVFEKSRPATFAFDGDSDDDDNTQAAAISDLMDAGEEMRQLTTPRTITAANDLLNKTTTEKLQEWLQTPATIVDKETTLLNEILEAYLGDTTFTELLIGEIAEGIASGQNTGSAVAQLAAPKPQVYDSLKQATTISHLEDLVSDLTDREKSGSLLYALYERSDNSRLIETLVQNTQSFEEGDIKMLVRLAAESLLDQGNVDTLNNASGPVADTARLLLSNFV